MTALVAARRLPRLFPEAVVVALLIVGSGVGSLLLGQDANTDLHRYRFYIGYAFVHGRLDVDLVPAALGTFLNPTLDSFHYLGIAHLPPRLFGFLLGALQGLNPALVFLLARRLLDRGPGSGSLAVLVGVLAATGPTAHSLLGTTMGDTTASIPFLLSLLLVLGDRETPDKRKGALGLAGSRAPRGRFRGPEAHPGPLPRRPGRPRRAHGSGATGTRSDGVPAFLAGTVLGFVAFGGLWCWRCGSTSATRSFRSPTRSSGHPTCPPRPFGTHAGWPRVPWTSSRRRWQWPSGRPSRLQEIPFRDARFLFVLVAALGWLSLRWLGKRTPLPPGQRNLLAYVLMAYGVWLAAFYYYRYAAILEFLAPLVLVILVQALLPRVGRPLLLAAGACLLLYSSVGSWQRQDWSDRWWRVTLPAQAHETDSLVLLTTPGNSFLVPFFPEKTRFVGLEPVGSSRLDDLVTATLGSHKGTLMVLASVDERPTAGSLERYALTVTDDCGVIRTGTGKKILCRVVRSTGAQPQVSPTRRH